MPDFSTVETWPSLRAVLACLYAEFYDDNLFGDDYEPPRIPFVNSLNVTERAGDERTGTWMTPVDLDWWRVLAQDQAAITDEGIPLSPRKLGVASTPGRDVLIIARRQRGEPVMFTAWRHRGDRLVPCCASEEHEHPDSPGFDPWMDGPGLCTNLRTPWSGHCAEHQTETDASWRLGTWRRASERMPDELDAALRLAAGLGMGTGTIQSVSGVDQTTIEDILSRPAPPNREDLIL